MNAPILSLATAGFCRHPEHMVLGNWKLSPKTFPNMFAVIEHPTEGVILYDTGYAEHFARETSTWPNIIYNLITPMRLMPGQAAVEQLRAQGIAPEDVRMVICSHLHGDHIAGIADFPRARYVFLADAWEHFRKLKGLRAVFTAWLPGLLPADFEERALPLTEAHLKPLPPEMAPFKLGVDLFGDGFLWVVPTPGHAAGHMSLWIRQPRGQWDSDVFLIGDAAWSTPSLKLRRSPTWLTRFIFDDMGQYRETLDQLATLSERGSGVQMIPSHCEDKLGEVGAWIPGRTQTLALPAPHDVQDERIANPARLGAV